MAVISFSKGSSEAAWVVAGWAFRQVLADVIDKYPEDSEMTAAFSRAEEVGYLQLGFLDSPTATRFAKAIVETAADIRSERSRSGIIDRFHDEATTTEYFKGLQSLLQAAEAAHCGNTMTSTPEASAES